MITEERGGGSLEGSLRRSGVGKHRKCPWVHGFGVGSRGSSHWSSLISPWRGKKGPPRGGNGASHVTAAILFQKGV